MTKNHYLLKVLTLISCVIFFCAGISSAEDISFEATVDKNVSRVGSGIKLSLTFNGIQNIPAPDLPDIKGFEWKYIGPSTLMSIVNNKVTSSITHIYLMIPEKTGELEIPSLSITYNDKTYSSKPIPVEIVSSSSRLPAPTAGGPSSTAGRPAASRAQDNTNEKLRDKLFLSVNLRKNNAYVNEKIPLSVKLYINNLSVRNITYPIIENEAFLIDKFSQPRQYQEVLNGIAYTVIDFGTDIYGLYPGSFRIDPVEVSCVVAVRRKPSGRTRRASAFDESFFNSSIFESFFGQYENHPIAIRSSEIPIEILALPDEGKPESFDGALGNFNFTVQASPRAVQVGDPITLLMKVSGTGNFNTVNPPRLDISGSFKTYEPDIKLEPKCKTFEQVIIPKSDKVTGVPEVSFSFFNTGTKAYKTITAAPIPIDVRPLKKGQELKVFEPSRASGNSVKRVEILGRDIVYIKDSPGVIRRKGSLLCAKRALSVLFILPALAVILAIIMRLRRDRLVSDVRYARRLKAPRKAKKNLALARGFLKAEKTAKFYDAVFKALQEYIGDKFHLSTAGITSSVIDELKARGVDRLILDDLKRCFDACDSSRYAPLSTQTDEAASVMELLESVIDRMEKLKV